MKQKIFFLLTITACSRTSSACMPKPIDCNNPSYEPPTLVAALELQSLTGKNIIPQAILDNLELTSYCHLKPSKTFEVALPPIVNHYALSSHNQYLAISCNYGLSTVFITNLVTQKQWEFKCESIVSQVTIDHTNHTLFILDMYYNLYMYNPLNKTLIYSTCLINDSRSYSCWQTLSDNGKYYYVCMQLNNSQTITLKQYQIIDNTLQNKITLYSIKTPDSLHSCCLTHDNKKVIISTMHHLYIIDINSQTHEEIHVTLNQKQSIYKVLAHHDNETVDVAINQYGTGSCIMQRYSLASKELLATTEFPITRFDQFTLSHSGSFAIFLRTQAKPYSAHLYNIRTDKLISKEIIFNDKTLRFIIPMHGNGHRFVELYSHNIQNYDNLGPYTIALYP